MKRILRACLIALLASLSTAYAGDCRFMGEVCSDATPCKNIGGNNVCLQGVTPPPGGINVSISCWEYTDSYECKAAGAIDYCQPLRDVGCFQTNTICTETLWDGSCKVYTNTFKCGSPQTPTTGVIELATTYTITTDGINTTACDSLANNSSCTQAQEICIEGPETRNINGLDVYKDCWAWERTYTCSVGQYNNYCMPLEVAGCQRTQQVCTRYDFLGECVEYENTFNCDARQTEPLPTNVTYLSSSYSIIEDGQNVTACTTYSGNPNCTKAGTVCIEGPETRNINGLDVYKDCWKWEEEYTCASETLVSNCAEYANDPNCQLLPGSECSDELPGGQCGMRSHTYRCVQPGTETSSTQVDCSVQSFCIDGNCIDAGSPPDTDIGLFLTGMEAVREAGNYDLFKGELNRCERKLWGLGNCCKSNTKGASFSNSSLTSSLGTAAFSAGTEVIKVYGSYYLYEALGSIGTSLLTEYAIAGLASLPTGSFSFWGLQFSVDIGTGISFVGFDPWSLAFSIGMYLLNDLLSCTQDEQILAMKRGQNLCHKVGTYCSQKVLGSCVTKTESHCCFPSRLARIINQQGRPQIGKSWGTPKAPDCSGFTPEELANLRFDQMDLSEFVNEIKRHVPAKSSAYATQRLDERMRSYYGP